VDHIDTEKVVVNLTDRVLDLAAVAILSTGSNFAHTTNPRLNLKDVISVVKCSIQHLPTEAAEEIRQETNRILRHSKSQKRNISKAEREALLALRSNEDVTILPADKGNATVVLSSTDYHNKIKMVLDDPVYRRLGG
jgi:hypothetical protein